MNPYEEFDRKIIDRQAMLNETHWPKRDEIKEGMLTDNHKCPMIYPHTWNGINCPACPAFPKYERKLKDQVHISDKMFTWLKLTDKIKRAWFRVINIRQGDSEL